MILLCFVMASVALQAEVVTLKNGTQVRGTIVLQNDEVVILRDASGARFQYPRSEVVSVVEEKDTTPAEQLEEKTVGEGHKKKASILVEAGVGASILPGDKKTGVAYSADLLFGSHNLADRRIFVGGGLGYHGDAMDSISYNFLPIQAALRMPFVVGKHAPIFGMSVGYGIALSKQYVGGIYAQALLGYRYEINSKTALALSADVSFQQARMTVTEAPDGTTPAATYTNQAGRSIVRTGLKFSLFF